MSMLSKFIKSNLLSAVEQELIEHAPHIQQIMINELQEFAHKLLEWAAEKLTSNEEKPKDMD